MPFGPGKYDPECTALRESAESTVAIAIIMDGKHGSGFSIQSTYMVHPLLIANALQAVVNELRKAAEV